MSDIKLWIAIGGGTVVVGALIFFAYCAYRDGRALADASRKLREATQSRDWWRDWANKLLARVREQNAKERKRDLERAEAAKDDPKAAADLLDDALTGWTRLRPPAESAAPGAAVPGFPCTDAGRAD